jgi:alpha-beta hydrolase superfamily lysophospholipase
VYITDGAGQSFFHYEWYQDDIGPPRAIVQIVHGMMEHAGRYAAFAEYLAQKGFLVVAEDHYGHGQSARDEKDLGHLDGKRGWEQVLEQIHVVRKEVSKQYPGLPYILLGHSMGSTLAFNYATRNDDGMDGLIFSGWPYSQPLLVRTGACLATGSTFFYGPHYRNRMINYLSYKVFNKPFEPARTPFDWLSRDEKEVDLYMGDPLCGFDSTSGFYKGMFHGMLEIKKPDILRRLHSGLPILIIEGENDPVGHFGKEPAELAGKMKTAGLERVTVITYPGARHELFHETNRNDVFGAIIGWLDEVIPCFNNFAGRN